MKEMFSTLNESRKTNPSEFYGGFALMFTLVAVFYASIWIFH